MANGILKGIGQGLRIAGGALSPQAFRQEGIQRENIRGIEANKSSQARAILINAIMQGAINPDSPEAQKILSEGGLQGIGPGVQARQFDANQANLATERDEEQRLLLEKQQKDAASSEIINRHLEPAKAPHLTGDETGASPLADQEAYLASNQVEKQRDPETWNSIALELFRTGDEEKAKEAIEMRDALTSQDKNKGTLKRVMNKGRQEWAYIFPGGKTELTGQEAPEPASLFGGLVPAFNTETNTVEFVQASKGGGVESASSKFIPLTAEQKKALPETDQNILTALNTIKELDDSIVNNTATFSGVVGPQGAITRGKEILIGLAAPWAKTPALTFKSTIEGLKGRILRDLVGPGGISKAEWDKIDKTLGDGLFTTPQHARDALANVEKIISGVAQKNLAGKNPRDAGVTRKRVKNKETGEILWLRLENGKWVEE